MKSDSVKNICSGDWIDLKRRGTFEFASKSRGLGVVVVVPLLPDNKIILIEQYRPPVDANVIELPAGLWGDVYTSETAEAAADRELLEETGYRADKIEALASVVTSGGLTDEIVHMFVATGLNKTGKGGGIESEKINVHVIDRFEIDEWLLDQEVKGKLIDCRVWAGLRLTEGISG